MSFTIDQAEALLAAGQAADGIALLEPEARRHPESFELWHCLGRAYGLAGRVAEAEGAFRAAVRLRPDQHDAYYNLALSLAYQGRLRESVGHFVRARELGLPRQGFQETLLPILVSLLQEEPQPSPTLVLAPLPERPLVSVIMPTRDRPLLLRDALESLSRQSYTRWEAIVINDAGADIGLALDAARREVLRIDLPSRGGPSVARNAGIKAARGEVIAFLDDDNLYAPDHLDSLVAALRKPGASLVHADLELVEERLSSHGREVLRREPLFPGLRFSRQLLLVRNYIDINAWAVRRESLEHAGFFDDTLSYLEDWDLLLRLSRQGPGHATGRTSAEYRVRQGSNDNLSRQHRHRPAVEDMYRRHDAGGHELVRLARELYLESL